MQAVDRDWTNFRSVLFVLSAIVIFSLIFTSGRFAGELASSFQIMFLRYAGGFVTVLGLSASQPQSFQSLQSKHRLSQALRALVGGLGGAAIIFGNTYMPLVDANAISQLSGVFMLALGIIIFRERLRSIHIAGSLVCILGAAVVVAARGAFTTFDANYLVPASVVIIGALLLALEGIFIKILTLADRPLVTLAHANFFGMLLLLIPAVLTWKSTGPVNAVLLCLGPLAILGQYCNIRGYTSASVSLLAPIGYASLIFAAVWGWVFFMELPTAGVILGGVLIAIGGTTLALSRR
ncbi:MAG: DMT family transporter [Candidatus Devosia phytovorans]|uniref:DMT family transporter n=1 Tax=Candidatus Devosia phytovorans TaxID=3121372 RepID=A0AAJ6B188_9HYPH|nr:DMT family transporter [Devosia sp.]WEK06022.1 MAG: DMT family transporter [Devosia sp.]